MSQQMMSDLIEMVAAADGAKLTECESYAYRVLVSALKATGPVWHKWAKVTLTGDGRHVAVWSSPVWKERPPDLPAAYKTPVPEEAYASGVRPYPVEFGRTGVLEWEPCNTCRPNAPPLVNTAEND